MLVRVLILLVLDSVLTIMVDKFCGIMLLRASMLGVCRLWGVGMRLGRNVLSMQGYGIEQAVRNSGLIWDSGVWLVVRSEFAEKASVSPGSPVGAIHSYEVAVMLEDLQHFA